MIERKPEFPDKKEQYLEFNKLDEIVIKLRQIQERYEIGQKEATWLPGLEYPNLPLMLSLMTDTHEYSLRVNTPLLNKHLKIIHETPNFFLVHNGDNTDNFNTSLGKIATGMYENPFPPQLASRAHAEKFKVLDRQSKIAAFGFGNHNDFGFVAGQDWYDTYLGQFSCPILTSGGLLHILVDRKQYYQLAMTHRYWGSSKLNPTNVCKRFMEHEYPDADIVFLGHTHQSEGLHFERGGKDRVAVIGGAYKDDDRWARTHGIGGRSGAPGWCVALWPNERKMQLFKNIETAQMFMASLIFQEESK